MTLDAFASAFGDVEVPSDSFSVRILDAAYDEFLSMGLRRATIDSVAKRAKVGRMTVIRRFPSKAVLIQTVLERENSRVIEAAVTAAGAQKGELDSIVEYLAGGIETLRHSPLFERLLETDPDEVVPFLTFGAGPMLAEATRTVATQMGVELGARTDGARAAEAILRVCHSVLLVPEAVVDLADPAELRAFLRPVIAALLTLQR